MSFLFVRKLQSPPPQSFMALATLASFATIFTKSQEAEEEEEEKPILPITEQLARLILLAESISKDASNAKSCRDECGDLATRTSTLHNHLRSVHRLLHSAHSFYERPVSQICIDVSKKLERARTLVSKCQNKNTNIMRYIFSITPADFEKVKSFIDNSIADIRWISSVFNSDSGIEPSLLPIASNQPYLAWVWSYISCICSGSLLYRNDAVKGLNDLCLLNAHNKEIIVEEMGIPPLLNLLKENGDPDAQILSVATLYNLADQEKRVRLIAKEPGVTIIVSGLSESPSHRVQVEFVRLVSRMVELDADVKEVFGRKKVIRPLVKLLGTYVDLDEDRQCEVPKKDANFPSIELITKEMGKNRRQGGSANHKNKAEREVEMESPEEKLKLKVSCVNALWNLAKRSLSNSMQIVEKEKEKGELKMNCLHYLAKIMEKEKGELKMNCLYTVMELAAVAEDNHELRIAFKLNALASKAVLDQLLRILIEEDSAVLLIPTTKAIGSLARTFSVKETRIIELLVMVLGHRDHVVAKQAVTALTKYVDRKNYNCVNHSKAVLEFHGLPKLMNLLKLDDFNQFHEVLLLCYLSVNVGNNKAFDQARAKTVLEGAAHYFSANSNLRDLFTEAIKSLAVYQAGASVHKHEYTFMVEI